MIKYDKIKTDESEVKSSPHQLDIYMDINTINVITLAYLGDSIYEVYIRNSLIKKGIAKVSDLQKEAVKYVSAKAQANILTDLIEKNTFTDEELDIIKRGRNYKRNTHPSNTDIITYKMSTGFEALIGYLYLENKTTRLQEILSHIEVK